MSAIVDVSQCAGCGACARVCPVNAIAVANTAVIDPDICTDCGACVEQCPQGALILITNPPIAAAREVEARPVPTGNISYRSGSEPFRPSANTPTTNRSGIIGILEQIVDLFHTIGNSRSGARGGQGRGQGQSRGRHGGRGKGRGGGKGRGRGGRNFGR